MTNEDIINKVTKLLKLHKIKYRNLYIEDNKLYIGAESSKHHHTEFIKQLKRLKLYSSNLVYGRWVFSIR